MPLVSVILPTCDRPGLLPRAVASVLAGTQEDFELLIVDHNRRAGPVAQHPAAAGWLADPRVRIVAVDPAVPRNAAAARNAGLAAARGEWITFLDDDDAYRPSKLAAQLELANASAASVVLCGGCFHLPGRVRCRGDAAHSWQGDALLNDADLGSPFLLHRSSPVRFAEDLFAGEDFHYAQAILAHFAPPRVPVVAAPLVDVYQDEPARERTNLRGEAAWRAARRTWWDFGDGYSKAARRLFVRRALLARAKLRGRPRHALPLALGLLRAGGVSQGRFVLNALAVSAGWTRGVS